MTFRHLEDNLRDENIMHYLEFFDELQEPTKTVLGYALDIASYLSSQSLSNKYVLFGGYAVLSNLMTTFGDSVAKVWRGSTDIDMAGNRNVLNSLRSGYHIFNNLQSSNVPDKRTLKLDITGESECKIDFYHGKNTRKGVTRVNKHFGIPLRVIRPEYIVRNKLYTPKEQIQHYGDILAMISVMERGGYSPQDVTKALTLKEHGELQDRIVKAEEEFRKDRFGFFPSKKFADELKRILHRKKRIAISN
ncbi:MAG TPA: hypothetical protein VJ208_03740 [Candidatus Nanoarchaeia archaeon]|nr:hypothetical protein [Candidatus Nanoarchaeia archaeon]